MATYVVEGRPPGAGGAWTSITPIRSINFHKEVNVLWQAQFVVSGPAVAPQNGQVIFFDMQAVDNGGSMRDWSGKGNNGSVTGTSSITGEYGNARLFNGSSDVITIPEAPSLDLSSGCTFAAWVNLTDVTQYRVILSKHTGGSGFDANYEFRINLTTGQYFSRFGNGVATSEVTSSVAVNDGTWHHVCTRFSSSGIHEVYVDGVLRGSLTTPFTPVANSASILVGNWVGASFWYKGSMDEVYLYNRTLSVPEITSLMNASLSSLLNVDNEVRIRETSAPKEYWRGRIRDVTNDTTTRQWTVTGYDNSILMQDAKWLLRRNFPAVPANVTMDEIMNSNQGQPSNGQTLRYDMETLNGALVADLTGAGNDGTLTNMSSVTGKWGLAYKHTGFSSHIDCGAGTATFALAPMSVAFWFSPAVAIPNGDGDNVICKNDTSGGNPQLATKGWAITADNTSGDPSSTFRVSLWGGSTQGFISDPVSCSQNGWVHIVLTWSASAGTVNLYVNGSFVKTGSGPTIPADNTDHILTGGVSTAGSTFFGFSVDELTLFNRVVSAAEAAVLAGVGVLAGGVNPTGVNTFTAVAFRADQAQRLSLVDGLSRAVEAEWFVDRNGSDQDEMNLVSRIGSGSSTDSFQFGRDSVLQDRKTDTETLYNDVVVLGNDSTKQLSSRSFHATTIRTTLSADYTAGSTGSMAVASSTGFPANGIVYIGMERVQYTGTDATHLGTTSVTRAYAVDGFTSLAAYTHTSGLEVYLHADTTTSPSTYYLPETPQSGSSIQVNGWRQATYADQFYSDQNGLDRLSQRFQKKFRVARESLVVQTRRAAALFDLGDNVEVKDVGGVPFGNTPYRVFAYDFSWPDFTWSLTLGNYRDTFDRRLTETTQQSRQSAAFVPDAATKGTTAFAQPALNIVGTTELLVAANQATGVKRGTKVLITGSVNLTTGTATTGAGPRIRRGATLSGPSLTTNPWNVTITAASSATVFIAVTDIVQTDNPTYALTVQQTSGGGPGNGTASQYHLDISPTG